MSALDRVIETYFSKKVLGDRSKCSEAELELQQLRADLSASTEQLELDNEECVQLRATIAEKDAAIAQARELLTTLDWNDWNDKAEAWLAAHPAPAKDYDTTCPLCTWRGPVELVNGVCPQCGVDWPAEYAKDEATA